MGVNGAWYEAHEPVQHFMFPAINKRKTSTSADGFVLNLVAVTYSIPELYSMDGKHRSAKEIPYPDENSKDKASKTIL